MSWAKATLWVVIASVMVLGSFGTVAHLPAPPAGPSHPGRASALVGATPMGARPATSNSASAWYQLHPPVGPDGRNRAGLVWDPAVGAFVLFGGYNATYGGNYYGDTWLLFNTTWTSVTGGSSTPPARATFGFTYDSTTGKPVLFGGHTPSTEYGDTWQFLANQSWSQVNALTAPSAREGVALCDDPADHGVLLFGGDAGYSAAPGMNDTWLFSNGAWTQLHPSVSPPARTDTACAWDAADQEVVLFGGVPIEPPATPMGDTWVYHAGAWHQVTGTAPAARISYTMAETPSGGTLLFGGGCVSACNDTWVFSNGGWTELTPTQAPEPESFGMLAYNPSTNATLQFGGSSTVVSSDWLEDCWLFAMPTLSARHSLLPIDAGATIRTNLSVASAVGAFSLTADWGDSGSSSSVSGIGPNWSLTHTYTLPGNYTATFTATDSEDNALSQSFSVLVAALPHVSVTVSPKNGTAPLSVDFNATVTGGIAPFNWSWKAGDGYSTVAGNLSVASLLASHQYAVNGTFEAKFTVTDARGAAASGTVNVSVQPASSPGGPGGGGGGGGSSSSLLGLPLLDWVALVVVVAVAAGAGAAVVLRRRSRPPAGEPPAEEPPAEGTG